MEVSDDHVADAATRRARASVKGEARGELRVRCEGPADRGQVRLEGADAMWSVSNEPFGVVDTGCTNSVAGRFWLDALATELADRFAAALAPAELRRASGPIRATALQAT